MKSILIATIIGAALLASIAGLYWRYDVARRERDAADARLRDLIAEQIAIEESRTARRQIGQITDEVLRDIQISPDRDHPIDAAILDRLRREGWYAPREPATQP